LSKTPLKAGDRVVFNRTESLYCGNIGITIGRTYKVIRTKEDNSGKFQLIWVINDRGTEVSSFVSRVQSVKGYAQIELERQRRKDAKVARKAAGRERKQALVQSQMGGLMKKPLLFAELSNKAVHNAIERYICGKLTGLIGVNVVGIEKTTEGYKVTLGQYE